MHPFIRDDDVVTVEPLGGRDLCVGQVIAFRTEGARLMLHRVVRVCADGRDGERVEVRGDNRAESDGWVSAVDVLGVVTRVERHGRRVRLGMGRERTLVAGLSQRSALQPLVGRARAIVGREATWASTGPAGESKAALPPETRALLFCAQVVVGTRDAADLRTALAACSSGEALFREAVRHGMLGHLWRLVNASGRALPATFPAERLNELYRQSARRSVAQSAHLLRVLDHLDRAGVTAMPIKGPAWAERLYGDVTLRHWTDLDIVVGHEEATAARNVLLAAGFLPDSKFAAKLLERRVRTEGELQFRTAANDVSVDLHWQMGVGHSAGALSGDELIARARPLALLGREVLTPSETDALLLDCLHGTRHRWASIELLLGLAVQVRRLPEQEWLGIMGAARRAGCVRRVVVAVAHTCRVFTLRVPREVSAALDGDPVARAFVASLMPQSLLGEQRPGRRQHFSSLLWTLAMEDTATENVSHVSVRLLRPGPMDWETFDLPPSLQWLYWPLRPARIFVRVALMQPRRAA